MHGVPGSRLLRARRLELGFLDLLETLRVRLITYDRPGYGLSSRNPGRRVADSAADIAAIADALDIGEFAVEGISSGSPHAFAAAALLPGRVRRLACIAPMAPVREMGMQAWSDDQDGDARQYFALCAGGGLKLMAELSAQDRAVRRQVRRDDPHADQILEPTRNGIWGWLDDELAAFKPWGFSVADIAIETALWFDPADHVLPAAHAKWLARQIDGSELRRTTVLGHGSAGDPREDWGALYSWLAQGALVRG
jgi:pimeloyl-ACP methyl ester carboxylesterase